MVLCRMKCIAACQSWSTKIRSCLYDMDLHVHLQDIQRPIKKPDRTRIGLARRTCPCIRGSYNALSQIRRGCKAQVWQDVALSEPGRYVVGRALCRCQLQSYMLTGLRRPRASVLSPVFVRILWYAISSYVSQFNKKSFYVR